MTNRSQLMVIVFISTAQLALTLLAVAWLFGWIHNRTSELAKHRINTVNQFAAEQIATNIKAFQLDNVKEKGKDWQLLQNFVAQTGLPDDGFVSVINARNGKIICHPEIVNAPSLAGKTFDSAMLYPKDRTLVEAITDSRFHNHAYAILNTGNSTQLVRGQAIPKLDVIVLAHQRNSGVHAINSILIGSLKNFAFAIALIIGLLGTILNAFMVKRILEQDQQIQKALEQKVDERANELKLTKDAIIFGLAKLAESRDNDTGEHLDRIRKYVTILAKDLKGVHDEIDDEYIHNLGIASSLHDIGKVGIPDSILLKPGKLTSLERSIMEKHTTIGGECLEAIGSKLGENDFLLMAREVAYWHHENWDGGGYPHKLVEDEIPISARIVAVADVYDALTSRRPYKRGMSHTESRAIILGGSGQKFDPEIVSAFLRHEDEFKKIARRYQNTLTEETPVLMKNSLAAIAEPQVLGTPQPTG